MNNNAKEVLLKLGYSKEDAETILSNESLISFNEDTLIFHIKINFEYLISLGYSKEDVLKMTRFLPSLYGLSIENIKKKIIFYKQNNLDFIVVDDTKNLMQSIDLTYARFMFFKEKNIEISQDNYSRLFYNAKQFEKQYGIDKSTLLEKYNYQEYINSKSIKNVI